MIKLRDDILTAMTSDDSFNQVQNKYMINYYYKLKIDEKKDFDLFFVALTGFPFSDFLDGSWNNWGANE